MAVSEVDLPFTGLWAGGRHFPRSLRSSRGCQKPAAQGRRMSLGAEVHLGDFYLDSSCQILASSTGLSSSLVLEVQNLTLFPDAFVGLVHEQSSRQQILWQKLAILFVNDGFISSRQCISIQLSDSKSQATDCPENSFLFHIENVLFISPQKPTLG